jgi:hypothetical protein
VVVGEVDGAAGQAVVDEIVAAGARAVLHVGDCSEVEAARASSTPRCSSWAGWTPW